jgi:FtsP/CotA-like multicopper oxidase with cupredoxin domain
MERYVPEIRELRERVIVVRGLSIEHDANANALRQQVDIPPASCGEERQPPEEVMTVNGSIRPRIQIAPGERQFWRIVNASADRYLDLQVDGQRFEIVALDGMPLAYHDPKHPTLIADHFLVSPAGRLEAIVTGPPKRAHAALRTLCVNTGPVGDPNPAMVLADLVPDAPAKSEASPAPVEVTVSPPAYDPIDLDRLKQTAPDFSVTFTEDKNGFYINGAKFAANAAPMTTARVGTFQHWKIVNATAELHPFHIHQVHFLAYGENGTALQNPMWLDTVNVPVGGSVDVILDFTNPVIKGMSLFHCHLLNHEDKGMMAKILFK